MAGELENFETEISMKRCGKCSNNRPLTINRFTDGGCSSGNRCERGEAAK